jgi:copper homeostasis protein
VTASGGVRAANAALVVAATGVDDLHAAPRRPAGTARAGDVSCAGVGVPPGYDHVETDPDEVAPLRAVRTAPVNALEMSAFKNSGKCYYPI